MNLETPGEVKIYYGAEDMWNAWRPLMMEKTLILVGGIYA
jgi:hypothetical protein